MPDLTNGLFPANFAALALAHFMALLSPGPDFFLIVGHAARARFRGSVFICAGIAVGNALYIALAVAGWSGLRQHGGLYLLLELAGAVYLAWLGLLLVKSGRNGLRLLKTNESGENIESISHAFRALSPVRQFATGLASALLNPKNAIFYLTLMTVLIGPEASLRQQVMAGVWMASLVLLWDLCLAAGLGLAPVRRALGRKIPLVELVSGLVLLGMALGIAIVPRLSILL